MNKQFQEYVTSGAFNLTLSKRMIVILAHLGDLGPKDDQLNIAPYQALERRGLAIHVMGKGYFITKAGELALELLKEAGLVSLSEKLENAA